MTALPVESHDSTAVRLGEVEVVKFEAPGIRWGERIATSEAEA